MTAVDWRTPTGVRPDNNTHPGCPLTPIELCIIRHLAAGTPQRVIARELNFSPNSMRTTIARMLERTNSATRSHLVATTLRNGWIR